VTIDLSRQTEALSGWGRIDSSPAQVVRPTNAAEVQSLILQMSGSGRSVIGRGSGYSYGDPALNRDQCVVETTGLNRVLNWDPTTGIIEVEPGVTVGQLCQIVAGDGWWPPVLPGAKGPTVGGCLASNVHGKNNWRSGTFGEHVEEMDIVFADGSLKTVSPNQDGDLFRAIIGGFGLLGLIVRVRLRMSRSSGHLRVERFAALGIEDLMWVLDRWSSTADYMVGWIDGFGTGKDLGRGLTQIAFETDTPRRAGGRVSSFTGTTYGAVSSKLWPLIKPFANRPSIERLNAFQYLVGSMNTGSSTVVSRYNFDFFHDFLPNWNRAFKDGILQYQLFVPRKDAAAVFTTALTRVQEAGMPPFLTVLKLHRPDDFLLSEGVDGFSLSMDFAPGKRRDLLTTTLNAITEEIVLPACGRFYLAKDYLLTRDQARKSFGAEAMDAFIDMKRQVDPNELFVSDMYRRLFAD
jgi:decaprenylphospho-beta-D-ribofuranose 2-oxidase